MSPKDRILVKHFNKVSLKNHKSFRSRCGEIFSKNAADGCLKSGYTIKQCYVALAETSSQTVEECLGYISKITPTPNRMRMRLLDHLDGIVVHHANNQNDTLVERLVKMGIQEGQDGHAASERLFEEIKAQLEYQIEKYRDGLTAPDFEPWYERNPILVRVISALVVAGIVALAGQIFGLIDLAQLFQ